MTKIIETISSSRRRQFSQFVNNLEKVKNRRSDLCDSCCVLDSWRNINASSQLKKTCGKSAELQPQNGQRPGGSISCAGNRGGSV